MNYPKLRLRRRRRTAGTRKLFRETWLRPEDLIQPLFVIEGSKKRIAIPNMPHVYRLSIDETLREIEQLCAVGIAAVNLFGVPEHKDTTGQLAQSEQSIVSKAVRAIKTEFPDLVVMTDVCLCSWLTHGHCGIVDAHQVLNDASLPILAAIAVQHARAGADIVSPSDMMDGRVEHIRQALDSNQFFEVGIMSYAAKMASSFYAPFRNAADGAPQFGDRRSYQMDYANAREAVHEVLLDANEGADIIMIKPAITCLDIIFRAKQSTLLPVAAYQVSGEYAQLYAAHAQGCLDLDAAIHESLTAIKRAGADLILTYFAKHYAAQLRAL